MASNIEDRLDRFEIRLFGTFRVLLGGTPQPVPGRNDRRLLALLSLSPGRVWERRDVAAALWPDAEFEVTGNRLRTALVSLRKSLADVEPVLTQGSTIQLNAQAVESDLEDARRWEKRIQLAADASEQRASYSRFLEIINAGLLPSWDEDWLIDAQESWKFRRLDALQRSADLALESEDYLSAGTLADTILSEFDSDHYAWSTYLVAMARQGQGREALRRFRAISKKLASEGFGEQSPQLHQLAKAIRDGAYGPNPALPVLPTGSDQAILRAFRQMLQVDPAQAIRFVCSDAFRLELMRTPEPCYGLLEMMLSDHPSPGSDVSLRIMTMRTSSVLQGVDRVIEIGTDLLKEELDATQRRLVLAVLSFTYYLIRDFDKAFLYVDQALEIAEKHALPHHLALTKADKALYLWHIGKEREALDTHKAVYEAVKDLPEQTITYGPAYLCGIAGAIHAGLGEIPEADEWLGRGHALAKLHPYREHMHQMEPSYGYVRVRLGHVGEAIQLTMSGLSHFLRTKNYRAFAAGLDYAAGVFVEIGNRGMALACLEWSARHRPEFKNLRSPIEERFAAQVRERAGDAKPDRTILAAHTPREALEVVAAAFQRD
jgi:DNA-binding SARP family transcriptional activator